MTKDNKSNSPKECRGRGMRPLSFTRRLYGLTQENTAKMLGISRGTLSKFETHETTMPLGTLFEYCYVLDLSVSEVGAHVEMLYEKLLDQKKNK